MASLKGQITLFVALGIALLIIGGLVTFALTQNTTQEQNNIQETGEIRNLIRQCAEENSKQVIKSIGNGGGYADFDSLNLDSVVGYPTKSEYLSYAPSNLPYWYFVDDDSQSTRSYKPLLKFGENSIRAQIENALIESLEECASLEDYEGRVEIQRGELSVFADIGNEAVIINIYWPHTIISNGVQDSFDELTVIQDVELQSVYELLDSIVGMESSYGVFSSQTMSLITLYSGLDEPIPPTTDVDFSLFGGQKLWVTNNVKQEIEEGLLPLMELYQVKGSKNYNEYTSNSDNSIFEEGIYKSFDLDTTKAKESLEVDFTLPSANRQLSINNGATIIRGEDMTSTPDLILKLVGLGVTSYKAVYSLAYPMIVTVTDDDAFGGEGFHFSVAFEVNIQNNQPAKLPFSETSSEFASEGEGIQLFELDEDPFTVEVYEKNTGRPINDAIVTYICVEEFYLGRTNMDGKVTARIPNCLAGGIIEVFHPAYGNFAEFYDHDGSSNSFDARLWPIVNKQASLSKINTGNYQVNDITTVYEKEELSVNDFALLIIEPVDQSWPAAQVITFGDSSNALPNPEDLTSVDGVELEGYEDFEFPEGYNFTIDENEIQIVPGNYRITGLLLHNTPITIPEKTCGFATAICGVNQLLTGACCQEMDEQTFDSWPKGGIIIETEFFMEDVYSDNTFDFVFEELKLPRSWDDIIDDEDEFIWTEEDQNRYAARIDIE